MISKSQPGRDVVVPADLDAGQDRCDDVVAEGEERADGAGPVPTLPAYLSLPSLS